MRKKLSLEELNRPSTETYKKQKKHPIVVVAENIRSGMNIGSIFRSCDAFAIEKLILTGISPQPPHKEITKTAIGATSSVDWEYHSDVISILDQYKQKGYDIYAIEQTADSVYLDEISKESKDEKIVIILGNEIDGVSQEGVDMADVCVEIKQFGTKHSLNVSVCAGIVLWTLVNKVVD